MWRLLERVLSGAHEAQFDIGDREWSMAAQWSPSLRATVRDAVLRATGRLGLTRRRFDPELAAERLARILAREDQYARTFALLGDEASRELYLDVLSFHVLGPWHVKLPVTPRQYAEAWNRAESRRVGRETFRAAGGIELPLLAVDGLRLWAHPIQVVALFDLRQYAYQGAEVRIEPQRGDVVLDGGAGYGDSAVAFARLVGDEGRVVSCELDPLNLEVLHANLQLNPQLADRVTVVLHALWRDSESTVQYTAAGGLSAIDGPFDGPKETAETRAIDDLGLDRVDFLKLDVEGAEVPALEGSRAMLQRDRPRLALAIYHSLEELASVACVIDDMRLGYRFYLGHFTPGAQETILFASCPPP